MPDGGTQKPQRDSLFPFRPRKIKVTGGGMYLDSPANANGVKINATQDSGWLHVTVETDDSIIGYAVTVNGKDLP